MQPNKKSWDKRLDNWWFDWRITCIELISIYRVFEVANISKKLLAHRVVEAVWILVINFTIQLFLLGKECARQLVVQKNQIQELLRDKLITLKENKNELINIISN